MRNSIKQEQRKRLVFIDTEKDDQFEILFKYYETLRNFKINVEHQTKIHRDFEEDFIYAEKLLFKPHQLEALDSELRKVRDKTDVLTEEFTQLKDLVSQTQSMKFLEQLRKEVGKGSSVKRIRDNEQNIKLNEELFDVLKQLEVKADVIFRQLKSQRQVFDRFREQFPEQYTQDTETMLRNKLQKDQNKRIPESIVSIV